jgi:hypothetical protein
VPVEPLLVLPERLGGSPGSRPGPGQGTHARQGAGVRKAAALEVSRVSVARGPGAAGPARMRPGRRQMAGRNPGEQDDRDARMPGGPGLACGRARSRAC